MIASNIGMLASLQGTKQPSWARTTLIATYRIYVLFPPILGPVIICMFDFPFIITQSFAIQPIGLIASISGCLDSKILRSFPSVKTFGLTHCIELAVQATTANATRTSNSAIKVATVSKIG